MKARHILPFVILCSLLLSCKDDRPFEDAYLWQNNASLTASLTTLLFEADASTQTVAINTNSGYGITVDQTWLTVERAADNQTLTVSVQANTTSTTRNATITINASGKSQTISVSQSASSLKVSESTLAFEASESSQTVSVTASGNYTYSTDASWLTIIKGTPTTRAESVTELTITAAANTEESERTATITLTLGSITKTIEVTQEGANTRTFTITGNGKTVTFKMKKVQGGTFQMGRESSTNVAMPIHSVTITSDYYMGETEVTQALWYAVMGQSPTSSGNQWRSSFGLGDNYPSYYISYEDCQLFLSALNSKLSSQLGSGEQFRFPTEAEWEFAARGGNKSNDYIYSGSNTIDDVAWYWDNSYALGAVNADYGTHTVKTKAANELGLYDMSGNLWELCYDWYGTYSGSAQTDPSGPYSGSKRLIRGGSWSHEAFTCSVTYRTWYAPSDRNNLVGFRLCLGAPISEPEPSLSVSPTSLSFDANASSQQVYVTANGDYTYSTDAPWLTITQSSDNTTLTVAATANPQTSERTATITLTLGSLTQTINVTQEANEDRTFTVTGNGKTVTFKMIKVEGGTFQMGSTDGYSREQPIHSVTLTKDYYMCETEVTQALWSAVMGLSPTSDGDKWNSTYGLGDNYPAYYISYEDCRSFLSTLNSKLSSQLGSGEQFRFPTEAEWEFAAKGGNKSKGYTYAGSNTIDDVAWYTGNSSSTTHLVKTKAANELGLYDMSGNLYEWCYDWFDLYSSSAQTDPTGATSGSIRVLRGGGWGNYAGGCRVSNRNDFPPGSRLSNLGLRLCLGAPIE
ncbi:MAG: SUMF1/EgtB/PvdO family nonheme iron enzyme [Bacteroidaceae bacterium]|nr:SUMF1/EgtB/PvdO family nonheme iron enzyme [Bacteroidaceae bacterium]